MDFKTKDLLSEYKIQERVKAIAEIINQDYLGESLCVLVVLKGAFLFASDLFRQLDLEVTIDFIRVKTYQGTKATTLPSELSFERSLDELKGQNILIVEDIVDKGKTAHFILEKISHHKPKSLKLCSLLYKNSAYKEIEKIDYPGFLIEDDSFVIGYGLDYDERFRNLRDIKILLT